MATRSILRGQRGTTLVETMIASLILVVAVTGFVGAMNNAASATAVAHRRTAATLLRSGLLDRLAVSSRESLAPAVAADAWVVDGCFDVNAQVLLENPTYDAGAACPDGTAYRRWVRVVDLGDRRWQVGTYVERVDVGCAPEDRYSSMHCVAADQLLTD